LACDAAASSNALGTHARVAGSDSRITHIQSRSYLMLSKLALSALAVASLVGMTAVAPAQTQQPAPGASSEGNVGPGATHSRMKSHKMVKTSKMKPGTTTGMSRSRSSQEKANPSTGYSK